MYIQSLTSSIDRAGRQGMVDPNVVSGSDFDERLYLNYDHDDPTLVKLEEEIVLQKGIVDGYESALKEKQDEYNIALNTLSPINKELNDGYALRNSGTVTDPQQKADLDIRILELQQKKDYYRARISSLNGELSQLNSKVGATKGMVTGLIQEFEEKTGQPYTGTNPFVEKKEVANEIVESLAAETKKGIIEQIGDKVGLSKTQTIFALGGIAVLGIVLITKK